MEKLKLEKDKGYFYSDLESWFEDRRKVDPNMTWDETGPFEIGKAFINVDESGLTYTFILDGYNDSKGAIYKLIFVE